MLDEDIKRLTDILIDKKDYLKESISMDNNEIIDSYMSLEVGYFTNSELKIGSALVSLSEETLPEIIKDLKFEDIDLGLIWYPAIIKNSEKGMVFPMGESVAEWGWAFVPMVDVTEEEKEKYPIPGTSKFYSKRSDLTQKILFDKKDFIFACELVGMLSDEAKAILEKRKTK